MSGFRLALLNPNTDARHTEAMHGAALAALPAGVTVDPVTARRGPASIESAADAAVAAGVVVDMVRAAEPADAYLIACFGDPGLDAARELTEAPIVGVGQAGIAAACLVAARFAVVTTLARGVPDLWRMLEREGAAARCTDVLVLDRPVSEQGAAVAGSADAIVAAGERALAGGAEAIVLACGAMADVAADVSARLGVPACDGVAFGACLAHALWSCGLRTSKAGAHGWPEPIPYTGMPALSPGAA